MKERLKKLKLSPITIILIGLVLVQCIFITVLFATKKNNFHSDEMWNYGYANSHNTQHIHKANDGSELNMYKWTDSDVLSDYITVDKEHRFDYASVYENASRDLNPPLQLMLLHTICSFFPGVWSKWFCFIINIVAFAVIQIYLFKLIRIITKNDILALAGTCFFGFTVGAINITVFLRIYALAVMFAVMFAYYATKLYYKKDEPKEHLPIITKALIVCLLGAFTLHAFLPFAFIITLCYSLYYLFTKHFKLMFKFGFAMLIAVGLSILIFPATIQDTFMPADTYHYTKKSLGTAWQFKIYWHYLNADLFGLTNSIWPTMTFTYIGYALLVVIFFTIPICFVSRNEEWYKEAVAKVKNTLKNLWKNKKDLPYPMFFTFIAVNFIILIAASRTSIMAMGGYSIRYIFIAYPMLAVFITCLIQYPIRWICKKKSVATAITLALSVIIIGVNHFLCTPAFLIKELSYGFTFDDIEENANCIILLSSDWLLTSATSELYDTNKFLAVNSMKYDREDIDYNNINTDAPIYLLVDLVNIKRENSAVEIFGTTLSSDAHSVGIIDKDKLKEYFKNLDITTNFEYLGYDSLYGRPYDIYRLN